MGAIDLKPGQTPTWADDLTVRLLPGTHVPLIIPGHTGITILGVEGPDKTVIDAKRGEFAVRGNDGCDGLHLEGFTVANAGHGVRVTASTGVTVKTLVGHDCAVEVVHLAHCLACVVDGLTGWALGHWRFQTYGQDQAHLLYFAEPGDGAVARNLDGKDIGGSLFQCNAASTRERATRLLVENAVGDNCGWGGGGTYPFSLMSVRSSIIRNFRLTNCKGIAALHDDGQGTQFACYGVAFGPYSLVNTPNKWVEVAGSSGNTFTPGAGWQPGTVTPPIEPPPVVTPPTVEEVLADHEARIRRLEAA